MKHLKFPFPDSIEIEVQNGRKRIRTECELASSEMEIYQSLSYRSSKDHTKPLVLLFEDPVVQYFSKQSFPFPVVQVSVDQGSKVVRKLLLAPSDPERTGGYIQSFVEFSMVILLPADAKLVKQIIVEKTRIREIKPDKK